MAPSLSISEEQITHVCAALFVGATQEAAHLSAGIPHSTFYKWMAEGRAERERLQTAETPTEPDPDRTRMLDMVDRIERALADFEANAMRRISEAGNDHWQALAWSLERRFPHRYGRVNRTELTGAQGGPVAVTAATVDLPVDDQTATKMLEVMERAGLVSVGTEDDGS